MIWKVREGGLGSTAWVPGRPDTWPGWEDSAVPPDKVGRLPAATCASCSTSTATTRRSTATSARAASTAASASTCTPRRASRSSRRSWTRPPTWSCAYGGSLSGEHGDGQARGEFLPQDVRRDALPGVPRVQGDLGPALEDEPRQEDRRLRRSPTNLRLGPDYNPPQPATHFHYPDDKHSFARAALRCVGVGKCRQRGRRGHVPQLPGDARGEGLARAAGRTCSSR